MAFLTSLLSSDDRSADSVIVGGLIALAFVCGLETVDVIRGHDFQPLNFATASGALLAAMGGAKRLRDGGADVRNL